MSMEIKQGDKVRVSKGIPQFYRRYNSCRVFEVEHQVVDIEDGLALLDSIPSKYVTTIPCKYLVKVGGEYKPKFKVGDKVSVKASEILDGGVFTILGMEPRDKQGWAYELNIHEWYPESDLEPYTEPTEQAEAEKTFDDQIRDVLNGVEYQDYGHPIQAGKISHDISYWDAYTADLAKEVALKVANKYNNPKQSAEYAVSVAKAVVEGLKRK